MDVMWQDLCIVQAGFAVNSVCHLITSWLLKTKQKKEQSDISYLCAQEPTNPFTVPTWIQKNLCPVQLVIISDEGFLSKQCCMKKSVCVYASKARSDRLQILNTTGIITDIFLINCYLIISGYTSFILTFCVFFLSLHWNSWSTVGWSAMEFCTDIHDRLRMNPHNFNDPGTFPLAPPWGWHL